MNRSKAEEPKTKASGALPRMMLAFVIRRCTVELGHVPSAAELAEWANTQRNGNHKRHLFGRPISEREAAVILKHQSRLVSALSAQTEEIYVPVDELAAAAAAANVVRLDRARTKRKPPLKRR